MEELIEQFEKETRKPHAIQEMWIPKGAVMPTWDLVTWLVEKVKEKP